MSNADRQKRYRERRKALRGDVTDESESVTVGVTDECPKGHDKKMWEYACERATRARRYAEKMSEHIRAGEERFQSPEWQYADQMRYPLPMVKEKDLE